MDEADLLLSAGEEMMAKRILKSVQHVHASRQKETREYSQILLTAATLPSSTPKSVGKQLLKLFPRNSVKYFKTESVHKTLQNAEMRFTECASLQAKFAQLEKDLDALHDTSGSGSDRNDDAKLMPPPKVLIFANTSESASRVIKFLCREDHHRTQTEGDYHRVNVIKEDCRDEEVATGTEEEEGGGRSKWWEGKVGVLFSHKDVPVKEREEAVRGFRQGSYCVLVCTDLGSRGLDFTDCKAVIQFDFPENSEFFLHRAGRTARAGRAGVGE